MELSREQIGGKKMKAKIRKTIAAVVLMMIGVAFASVNRTRMDISFTEWNAEDARMVLERLYPNAESTITSLDVVFDAYKDGDDKEKASIIELLKALNTAGRYVGDSLAMFKCANDEYVALIFH